MSKDKVTDLITDKEIAFARLVLAGEMSDQQAAEAAGLSPTTAAYTKSKPRVQAWMQQYRAAMDKLILEQEAENLRRRTAARERVLNRLWAVADLAHDQTRNSMVSQMKALALIVAIEGLIPDRRAGAQKSPAPVPTAKIYQAAWLRQQDPAAASATATGTENDQPETAPPPPDPSPSTPPRPLTFAEENSSPYTSFVPDTRGPFQLPRSPFTRRRR